MNENFSILLSKKTEIFEDWEGGGCRGYDTLPPHPVGPPLFVFLLLQGQVLSNNISFDWPSRVLEADIET